MYYERRYLQFNNLVFDGYDMLSDFDGSISFKGSSEDYSYGDGSYRPYKSNRLFLKEQTASMTLTLRMKKIPCEYRPYYMRWFKENLSRPGKLWAIENNELLWAFASVTSMSPNYSHREDRAIYDVSFALPEGVWHKADKQKTFLTPYDVCTFLECKGYKIIQPCSKGEGGDCCITCQVHEVEEQEDCFCCCSDALTEDMQLCYHLEDLEAFYGCDTPYQIVYDCLHGEKFADDILGQKICTKDVCEDSVIAGRFYSETDLSHQNARIIINGTMENPWITINGNTNIVEGEYDGELIIEPNGDLYYGTDCCEPQLLEPDKWVIPEDMTYGWTVNPGNNSIVVNLNRCCNGITCVYIQDDPITM